MVYCGEEFKVSFNGSFLPLIHKLSLYPFMWFLHRWEKRKNKYCNKQHILQHHETNNSVISSGDIFRHIAQPYCPCKAIWQVLWIRLHVLWICAHLKKTSLKDSKGRFPGRVLLLILLIIWVCVCVYACGTWCLTSSFIDVNICWKGEECQFHQCLVPPLPSVRQGAKERTAMLLWLS